ncbi:MAG: EAL domain-containing protein [Sulfurimonas sp.]|jgi:diguanylate cyclase (GGDEF)-like protein/PAS domain S-box-containing protein
MIEADKQRYQALMKYSSDGIFIMGMDGRLIECSQVAANALGYSMEEMTKLNVADWDVMISKNEFSTLMNSISTQAPIYFETKHERKDGSIYDAAITAIKIIVGDEDVIYASTRDITEYKKQNDFIKLMQSRYTSMFNKHDSIMLLINSIDGTIIDANESAQKFYGYTHEEFLSLNVDDINQLPRDEVSLLMQAAVKRKNNHYIFQHKLKNGDIHTVKVFASPIETQSGKLIFSIITDVTEAKENEDKLTKLLNEQQALLEVKTTGFVHLKDRCFLWVNDTFETMLGYEKGELKSKSARIMYFDDDEYERYGSDGYAALSSVGVFTREIKGIKKDGTPISLLASMTAIKNIPGEAMGVAIDITELKKQAELINKQNEEFKTIFDISRDGLAILDLESNFLEFNNAYLSMTGFRREELLLTSCIALSIPEDQERAIQAMKIITEIGYLESFEKTCIVKNGSRIVIKMAMSLMPDKKRIMISTKDITDIRHHEEQLEFIAHFDPLTKLPNRVLLSDRMKQSIATAHRNNGKLAIAYLDLDGFKQVNDTHGHDVGDILLIEVSKRMQNSLREGDTLARLGGDEFVAILLDQNDKSDTFTVLNRLLNAASSPIDIQNAVVTVSASIGVTFFTKECGIDADILLRQADQAMYEAKLRGKNQIAVFDDISNLSNQVGENALAIKNALNNNEFILYYQPKVNMKSGEVIGAEALIRWNDPQRGMIYPDEFLSVVDNRPLMYEIDKWVFNEALSQLCLWHKDGLDTKVSINISAYTFKQPDFISFIDETIAKHPNLQPCQIDIEILESSSLHEIEEVRQIIEKLHARNITVSLDDFGTGYSTLSYLKKLRIDTLKIDKSFVLDILHDEGDLSIVNASVGLAEAFNAKPLAEGVESVDHGNVLLGLGCHLAQGYIISRAMSPDLLPKWVKEWKPPESWQEREKIVQ